MPSNLNSVPTILAVDDSAVMLELIERPPQADCRVLVADSAAGALSIISPENSLGLLLDVPMPGMDGLELCRAAPNSYQVGIDSIFSWC